MLRNFVLLFFVFWNAGLFSQCFEIRNGLGVFDPDPVFVSCTPGDFTIFIQPDQNIGPYSIDWGDSSALASGASLTTTSNLPHTYTATTDTFNVTITDSSTSCVVNAKVIMERNPLASIQLPTGDDNFGCTPVQFRFINSSTQVSETTVFTWDFGDGSPIETFDFSNQGDTITHTYLPGIGVQSCDLEVTLTATNNCGASTASFFPLKVWDLDEAVITPSATLLCYPDTTVRYTNNTIRNCFPEGNQSQRFEKWNFGDYWGLGSDSIIDWRPWNPPIINPPPIGYPGVGIYTATLIDSSFCGLDTSTVTIEITNPPVADITSDKDTICEGEVVTFFNNSTGGANEYEWDFDQGAGFQNLNGNNKTQTYNSTGDFTISLVVGIAGAQGCRDTATVDLHVLPSPVSNFTFDTNNECDSMLVNFTNTSTGAIVSHDWDFDNGNTFLGMNPPAQNYTNAGSFTVELTTTTAEGCSNTISQTLNVRETPLAGFTVFPVCLNLPSNFVDTSQASVDPITSYQWSFGDGDSSTVQDPTHTYNTPGTFVVTQIVDNGFCQDTATLSVDVETPPVADFAADTLNGCSPFTVNFTNQSSANSVSYRWNFGDGSAISNAIDTAHTFINNSSSDTTFVVQLISTTAFGCSDTTFDTVRVSPIPLPSFTSDAILDCGPITVNFTNTTPGTNLSFQWDFGDSTAISTMENPTHTFENKTLFISNFEVSLIVTTLNGCSDTSRQIVTVYPEPIFTFTTQPDSGCSPLTVRFPSVVGAVNYQWDFGDSTFGTGPTPTHTYINNTTNNQVFTARLIAQNSFGCRDTTFGNVLVYPNPTSNFVLDTNVGCQPLPINITNLSTGANFFDWDFGDGTTSDTADATFVKTYTNTSAFTRFHTIRLITETNNACKDTLSRNIEVHPFIEANFTSDTAACSPAAISFTNQSLGASSYSWQFGDNTSSTAINPAHTYLNNGTSDQVFRANLIARSNQGCIDSAERNITIFPKPQADYTLSDSVGCQPLLVTFTNNSSLADSCAWKYGDQTEFNLCSPTNTHTYTNTTSFLPIDYQSELVVFTDNGCKDTLRQTIRVNPEVNADFDADSVGCSPLEVRFQNLSQGAQTFEWDFGDGGGTPLQNPRHFFINAGQQDTTFDTKLKVTSSFGCTDSLVLPITVFPKPVADYTINTSDGCQPLPVDFTNNSSLADSCRWDFGDQNSSSSCAPQLNHTYNNTLSLVPIDFRPELRVFTNQGCSDTLNRTISVRPQVIADFDFDSIGCSPLDVTFRSQSFGAIDYSWDFGDGTFGNGMVTSHTFTNTSSVDATFQVQLIAGSLFNCNDTSIKEVTVRPTPIPDFTPSPLVQMFPNSTVAVNNQTNPGNWTYLWDYDDSTTSTLSNPPPHTYDRWGQYFIKLVAASPFCSDSITKLVTIEVPEPVADFGDSAIGCQPLEVDFINKSLYGRRFEWDFGDGNTANTENPSHRYFDAGEYTVSLKVTGFEAGLEDTEVKVQYIKVLKTPRADFITNKDQVFVPNDPMVFSNRSTDADQYLWNFGDGDTSIERSPVHFYQDPGEYQVFLIATSDAGCADTAFLPNSVLAEFEGRIEVPNAFTPNPNGPNGGVVSLNPAQGEINDVFYAKVTGAVNYELNIFNKWGELLFISKDMNIGWDGYYRGELSQQDVYVWKVKVEFADGSSATKVGDLLLLR